MTHPPLRIDRASPRRILARLLDDPSLVATVQGLSSRALGQLVARVGLEDCGELLALATTEQLGQLLDEDLWKSDGPGTDASFDAERFTLWLEVMLEAGEDLVARKLLELPEDLVTLALHRHVLVLDVDALREEMVDSPDAARIDSALEATLYEDFDAYQVLSRGRDGWDAIVTVLTALDRHDHAWLDRVLERCCAMSSQLVEECGGLWEVLSSEEMLESDLAAEREDRRAAEGFLAPSQAASFLALCRSTTPGDVEAGPRDPVTRAYFRELSTAAARAPDRGSSPEVLASTAGGAGRSSELERMLAELEDEERPRDARPVFLLEERSGARRRAGAGEGMFKTALATLHEREPRLHAQRMEELAYLTNALVAGCAVDGRSFRPLEAVVAAAATCNLGLEHLVRGARGKATVAERAVERLGRDGADKAFRVGWWLLHHEVTLPTCDALARAFLARARTANPELRRSRERAARLVADRRAQGRPWLARDQVAGLAEVDDEARAILEGLLGECPVLVGALAGQGDGGYRLDGERRFVACRADVARVRGVLEAFEKAAGTG